jgi:CRISPR-associated endonuclease/helicase Cas3
VDQALLGVISVRHFFLRQFGLAGKVVILDEIHTYDLYTGTLIDTLVKRLRELGCTVIILSATLTASRREQLLKAAGVEVTQSDSYPLLTLAPENSATMVLAFRPIRIRRIRVSTTTDPDAIIARRCLEYAKSGECVLWFRNTVIEAQASFRFLRDMRQDERLRLGLLHSRFPLWRREQLESFWLEALGKNSCNRPKGCVLVVTQVAEHSLDIDGDFLVTDLAPSDISLQRIGRLWRHKRLERTGEPRVLIHTLELTRDNYRASSAQALKEHLGRSRHIYAPYVLLRTFETWIERTSLRLPSDIRAIVESTYSEPSNDEPESWAELRRDLEARREQLRALAVNATLVMRQPLLEDDERAQTRISHIPTSHLVLAAGEPVETSKGISVQMLDGNDALIQGSSKFDIKAARIIHRNIARIPEWGIPEAQRDTAPEWLSQMVFGKAALGCVQESGEIFINGAPTGMTWDIDQGVVLPTNNENP